MSDFQVLDESQADETSIELGQQGQLSSPAAKPTTTTKPKEEIVCSRSRFGVALVGVLFVLVVVGGLLIVGGYLGYFDHPVRPDNRPDTDPSGDDEMGHYVLLNDISSISSDISCMNLGSSDRTRVCRMTNLCVSDDLGAFLVLGDGDHGRDLHYDENSERTSGPDSTLLTPDGMVPPMLVNAMDPWDDWWWRPHRFTPSQARRRVGTSRRIRYYPDAHVLLASSYAGFHMTHFLFNTAVPVLDRLMELHPELSNTTWPLPATETQTQQLPQSQSERWGLLFTEPELEMQAQRNIEYFIAQPLRAPLLGSVSSAPLSALQERMGPSANRSELRCYAVAHGGLGSRCPIEHTDYCERQSSAAVYSTLRRAVLATHVPEAFTDDSAATDAQTAPRRCNPPLSALPFVTLVQRNDRPFANVAQMESVLREMARAGRLTYQLLYDDGIYVEHDTPEPMLRDKLLAYCNTSIMISIHGNSFGNMLWMPPHRFTIEYTPFGFDTEMVQLLAQQVGHRHQLFPCRSTECTVPSEIETQPNEKMRSTVVNIEQFTQAVENALTWYGEMQQAEASR